MNPTPQSDLRVDLRIPAEWARIDPLREAVGRCLEAVFADDELREALQMVSAELLENAMKYGAPDERGVGFTIRAGTGELIVCVTNAIPDGSPHRDALRARLAWITSFADPAAAFLAAMEEIFARPDPHAESGLGLARIAHEGGCRVECDDSLPGQVTVRAVRPFLPAAEGA